MSSITLGGVPVEAPTPADMRFVGLIWGPPGAGKTTLAATAPGIKLWLGFDNDGEMSLSHRDDVQVMKFYKLNPTTVVQQFKMADPYGITKFLTDHPEIETVVFDSMTTYAYMALMEAVARAGGSKISMQQPGQNGYTYRNGLVLQATHTLMTITAKLQRNMIFTTHEGAPILDDEGNVTSITMILSTSVAAQVGLKINEVWHLADADNQQRIISVRPHTRLKPMKTRFINADKGVKFVWKEGEGIDTWWKQWKENGGQKIPLPGTK